MSKINDNVRIIADAMKAAATVDNDSGDVVFEKDAWEKTLPEGVTADSIKSAHEARDNFIAATSLALGELGAAASKENADLKQVSTAVQFYKDDLTAKVLRSRTSPNPAKPGETITKLGASSSNYTAKGGKNSGQLKVARAAVSELYADIANG